MVLIIISFFSIFDIGENYIPILYAGIMFKYLFIFLINDNIIFEAKIKLYKKTITIQQLSFNRYLCRY